MLAQSATIKGTIAAAGGLMKKLIFCSQNHLKPPSRSDSRGLLQDD